MFKPINLPPSEHHQFATGHSTEFGDNAMTVGQKVNAGFKHVYSVLAGLGATLADEIEYVAKTEFDAAVHELDEVKAELNNIKMMLRGLGFTGLQIQKAPAITDPTHSLSFTPGPVVTVTEPQVTITDPTHSAVVMQAPQADPVVVIGKLDK